MAASYPTSLPSFSTRVDGVDYVLAAHMNSVQEEIVALATELGINVAGSMTDLVTRLAVVLDDDGTLKLSGITEHTGIADNNIVEVDGTPVDGETVVWTAAGLNSLSEAEFKAAFNLAIGTDVLAQQVIGIANDNLLEVDGSVVLNDFLLATSVGVKGKTYAEVVALLDGAADWDFADHDAHNFKQVDFQDEHDDGNSGATNTINWNGGNNQKSTLTANCTYTFTAPAGPCHLQLKLIQDAGGTNTVTWPATVKWPGGIAPTLSAGGLDVDIIGFWYDGTSYHGVSSLDFS